MFKEFQSKHSEATPVGTCNEERNNNAKNHLSVLPYKVSDAKHITSSMQKQINRVLLDDLKPSLNVQEESVTLKLFNC